MYVMKANRLYDFVQCQKPRYADIISIICKPVRYSHRKKRFDPEQRVNVNCQSEVLDAMHQLESVHQNDRYAGILSFVWPLG